ncbi:PRKR-interacting protein 1 homolog [Acanthaster planci]|uniref:PRKR-interacting protein 1 homolog n=1 Tax=Acanthaster planci TaxID=133434 RepID=A0A8B7ZM87_ACAPL|nr:PRKR-interacting protein 1 homolog [Acanthaster planci]
MGSSAGAGSGEFHVYRGYRRREYARQMYIQKKAEQEGNEIEFQKKLEENQRKAEERTTKKREKRLKKKQKMLQKKRHGPEKGENNGDRECCDSKTPRSGQKHDKDDDDFGDEDEDDAEKNCFIICGQ